MIRKQYSSFFLLLVLGCSPFVEKQVEESIQRILFPANGACYREGELIDFISSGNLEAPCWISSMDGVLGTGDSIRTSSLSVGHHTIFVEGSDPLSNISIFIQEETLSFGESKRISLISGENFILLPEGKYDSSFISFSPAGFLSTIQLKQEERALMNCRDTPFNIHRQARLSNSKNILEGKKGKYRKKIATQNYQVGDSRFFYVANPQTGVKSPPYRIQTSLIYASESIYIWLDENGLMSEEHRKKIQYHLETMILPQMETFFGIPKDVDSDGHLSLIFTDILNQSGIAIGFFNPCDLFPYSDEVDDPAYNPTSNEADVLYLGVPDDSTFSFSICSILATLTHELQHLIHYGIKTYSRYEMGDKKPREEELFLDEGLSHLAESLCGYGVSGGNIAFVEKFLKNTNHYSLVYDDVYGNDDSAGKRGAMAMFLSWLFWEKGGAVYIDGAWQDRGGIQFLKNILHGDSVGLEAISTAYGSDAVILFSQWVEEMLSIQAGSTDDYSSIFHPVSKELMNFPLFAGEIFVSDSIVCFLEGVKRQSSRASFTLLPFSFCFGDEFIVPIKQKIEIGLLEENRNVLCSFLQKRN